MSMIALVPVLKGVNKAEGVESVVIDPKILGRERVNNFL